MEDESLVSVDQFLRDNGFSISDSALELASLSDDEVLSDADEREPPRFVLLEDEDLLLGRDRERLSGDRTSERPESDDIGRARQVQNESFDRSMLFDGSRLSLLSHTTPISDTRDHDTLSVPPSLASSSSVLELQGMEISTSSLFASDYQMTPEQEVEGVTMVSAASSTSHPPSLINSESSNASSKELDEELSDALGVLRSSVINEKDQNLISRNETEEQNQPENKEHDHYSHLLKTTNTEIASKKDKDSICSDKNDGASLIQVSDDIVRSSREGCDETDYVLLSHEVEETKEKHENDVDNIDRYERNVFDEGAWNGLNDLLRKNGLPAVQFRRSRLEENVPDKESLFILIHDVAAQLEQKNETIQDLLLASKRNSRAQHRKEGDLQSLEKQKVDVQNALERAKAEIQRLKTSQKKESENAEVLSKKLKNSCLRLQQQLKVSEHRVKAKEVLVERMQAKLQQQIDKDNMNKLRDRRAFRNLQDRDPRRANSRDTEALETISGYEAQREHMHEEIQFLKAQVAALNSELRDKENFIARQSRTALQSEPPVWEQDFDENQYRHRPGSSLSSDEMMLEQLEAARREQEVVAAKLRHREAVMIKKVAMIEQELLTAHETIAELKEENANLTLEAESRPSIRDYRLCQRRIHELERQVTESKLALDEATDLNELRKYMGTKELVERDRLNHRLHLNRLNTLPRETMLEVVKHVCRILHLTDITLIGPSLDKLCGVVAAVPRMEKFIRDVCGFVYFNLNENTGEHPNDHFELEHVLPTLQQWMVERQKLHALEGFKVSIITELCKRAIEPNLLEDNNRESSISRPTTLSRAIQIVAELVELEKSVIHHREIYAQAAVEVERRPNVLINQIVRHFSHLFQVKAIDGVLPKINETYLFINEMKNFSRVIGDLLHLEKNTSLIQRLNIIKERLEEKEVELNTHHAEEDMHGNKTLNFVVEKRRSQSNLSGDTNLVGVQQVREMSILIRELKRELGAASMKEILPRTKRLMELLSLSIHNEPEDEVDD
ncbi:uncharacterized protein PHALS_12065 [Plasmopara halstedii]|uniref:Centrosomal protein of 70 kDa n=1 Tax=Plasmopara halstedii TaxID=4781 RepID=A0A0P1AKE3_PLAHL|nr:uncharacterized protein PHALS_12065 [Plasmopara halstedii]CEG41736.1 hypothetical protein PHALS_12065 [Plasmopara halstedii]|eukprot:XP_024578105.1 hypothetical protein PHALS_12065 [Plasmopara halstedii]